MKFKVGQVVQNIKTSALYKIVDDKQPLEPITQRRISSVNENEYKLFKPNRAGKALRKYYAEIKDHFRG